MAEMLTARFRFHGELNDFLPPGRRRVEFPRVCAREASVKHMIEALGVPHTEVALVLVNGDPADLGRRLAEGDRVAVYPRPPVPPGQAVTLAGALFIADAHLGGLARLLRLAGFDTLYDNHFHDDAIVAIAAREGRVVLSRDMELLKRSPVARGRYLHALKPEAQFREVVVRLGLAPAARPFSLCLECNAPLRPLPRAEAWARLPEGVRRAGHTRFATCAICGRVFWEGSHWRSMKALLDAVLAPGVYNVPDRTDR